jgi:glycosyltransferase involved in cell wall biosynthesis
MYKGDTITVIIPCLNEEQGIKRVLRSMILSIRSS